MMGMTVEDKLTEEERCCLRRSCSYDRIAESKTDLSCGRMLELVIRICDSDTIRECHAAIRVTFYSFLLRQFPSKGSSSVPSSLSVSVISFPLAPL